MKSATMMWDYWSLNPESIHQVLILMSDRGIPYGYRHMNGYGSHTFSMVNNSNERCYVKFHFKTLQGIKNFTNEEANQMKANDSDFSQRDLLENISLGNFPKWELKIQIMKEADAELNNYYSSPFDVTKVWPHGDYPLIDVGILELNQIPNNYFQEVEQAAFAPAHVVDGIGYSPDKMLQGRILTYPDAQRYRLGVNYEQIPVNKCPYATNNYQRDGQMRVDGNSGKKPNYYPNSFDAIEISKEYKEPPIPIYGTYADWYFRDSDGENDHYSQPEKLFQLMTVDQKRNTINNIVNAMSGIEGLKKEEIINRQLGHWFKVHTELGEAIAIGLGIPIEHI
jgi:catalase